MEIGYKYIEAGDWKVISAEYIEKLSLEKLSFFLDKFNLEIYKNSNDGVQSGVRADRGGTNFFLSSEIFSSGNKEKFVIRKYLRGGLLAKVNKSFHLAGFFKSNRAELEFKVLSFLYSKGLNVPKPVFASYKYIFCGLFYEASICTKELEQHDNLLVKFKSNSTPQSDAEELAFFTGEFASELLELNVFHQDLHPGNVLIDIKTNKIAIIDFDKYKSFSTSSAELYEKKLISRWARSIKKHSLRDSLISEFNKGLKSRK